MILNSFENNTASASNVDYSTNISLSAAFRKFTGDIDTATSTTTDIKLSNIDSTSDVCFFGLNSTTGQILITEPSAATTTLTTQTISVDTDYEGTVTVTSGQTVTISPGTTVRITGTKLVDEAIDFTEGQLVRDRLHYNLGATYNDVKVYLTLTGTSNPTIGLLWAGVLKDYGITQKFKGDGYDFMCTSANHKALKLLDKEAYYITQASETAGDDNMLYGEISIGSFSYDDQKNISGLLYGDSSLKVSE
jgi:hypothetical protein